jgi:hypothetical protein
MNQFACVHRQPAVRRIRSRSATQRVPCWQGWATLVVLPCVVLRIRIRRKDLAKVRAIEGEQPLATGRNEERHRTPGRPRNISKRCPGVPLCAFTEEFRLHGTAAIPADIETSSKGGNSKPAWYARISASFLSYKNSPERALTATLSLNLAASRESVGAGTGATADGTTQSTGAMWNWNSDFERLSVIASSFW